MKKDLNIRGMKDIIESFEKGEISQGLATAKLLAEMRAYTNGLNSQSNLMNIRPFASRMGHAKPFKGRKEMREVV